VVVRAQDWNPSKSLEQNVQDNVELFADFLRLGKWLHLDGFVYEVRGEAYGRSVDAFGESVRRVLTSFSDRDPHGVRCMSKSYVHQFGWYFEYGNEQVFVTTFAPCYPSSSSRYQFEQHADSCFILFQPEYSFAWRNVDCFRDPNTNWTNPESSRDKIRCAYAESGRSYLAVGKEAAVLQPTAFEIVKPLRLGEGIVEWWKRPTSSGQPQSSVSVSASSLSLSTSTNEVVSNDNRVAQLSRLAQVECTVRPSSSSALSASSLK